MLSIEVQGGMLKALALIEILFSIICLAFFVWPVSGFCSGRLAGHDCESWFIFGVNIFAPAGLLALVCATWSIKLNSWSPQVLVLCGLVALMAFWLLHTD